MIPLVLFGTSHSLLLMTAWQMPGVGAVLLSHENPEISLTSVLVLQVMSSPYTEDNVCVLP